MIKRVLLTMCEVFASPILAVNRCMVDCWELSAPVQVQIGDKHSILTVGKFNACLFQGVSTTSLARVKASLHEPNRFLSKDEMTTLPGGKIRKINVAVGVFNYNVEIKLLKFLN
jgi:hypothetical protein